MAMFKAASLFDSDEGFRSDKEIRGSIRMSKNYEGEFADKAQVLMIFSTSKQRTYLIASNERLYCVLDDVRQPGPHVNWSLPKAKVTDGQRMTLEVSSRDKTDAAGLVDLGAQHKRWLFTKGLFKGTSIEEKVEELIMGAMVE